MCGSVGQKYFSLLGTSPSGWPELVAAKLDSLITGPHLAAAVHLLACIHHTQGSTQPDQLSTASMQATQAQQPSFLNADITVRAPAYTSAALQACPLGPHASLVRLTLRLHYSAV